MRQPCAPPAPDRDHGETGVRPTQLCYPPNPDFGSGLCRRWIHVTREKGRVAADLADNFHEMSCTIEHDGEQVTGVVGQTVRIPTSACPAAASLLPELIGTSLKQSPALYYQDSRARRHCTHLYDLAILAIRHAARGGGTTEYVAVVPDETDRPVEIGIDRDGDPVHRWEIRNGVIVSPQQLAGRTLGRGFARWAAAHWSDDEFDAATILSRTWLIAIGRQYAIDRVAGQPVTRNQEMIGRCFAYDPVRASDTVFVAGSIRDSRAGEQTAREVEP